MQDFFIALDVLSQPNRNMIPFPWGEAAVTSICGRAGLVRPLYNILRMLDGREGELRMDLHGWTSELSVLYSYSMRFAFVFVLKYSKRWHSDPISSVSDPNPSLPMILPIYHNPRSPYKSRKMLPLWNRSFRSLLTTKHVNVWIITQTRIGHCKKYAGIIENLCCQVTVI